MSLFGKIQERVHDYGVVENEAAVEVCKTKEGPNIFDHGGSWPVSDTSEFNRVHG